MARLGGTRGEADAPGECADMMMVMSSSLIPLNTLRLDSPARPRIHPWARSFKPHALEALASSLALRLAASRFAALSA